MLAFATQTLRATETGLESPQAHERIEAEAAMERSGLLRHFRERLDQGGSPAGLIRALDVLGRERDPADLPLILRQLNELDPLVSEAAMGALRNFGALGLRAVRELDDSAVDQTTRNRALERLLQDHILAASRRDAVLNPFRLDYAGRFAELRSAGEGVDAVMLRMLREARSEIRDDIAGQRVFYGSFTVQRAFTREGGLVVAALARSMPDVLMAEFGDLASVEPQQGHYFGWYERSPVTMEFAIFFARHGRTALVDRVISEIEGRMRWGNQAQFARQHVEIASLELLALGDHRAALERINDNIANLAADAVGASRAHYLRARILMERQEYGAALREIEDSMESGSYAKVLVLVDDAFEALRPDRRFQAVLRYCELAARRLDASQRPWTPDTEPAAE